MPHTYDFFVAPLACPVCGQTSPADITTNMTTYLRDQPDMASLRVGDPLAIDPERVSAKRYDGYLVVRPPEPGEPIRILQRWDCPSCCTPAQWAEILVANGVIDSIAAVRFDYEHFARSHLVANDAIDVAAELTGESYPRLLEQDLVQLLRERLPAG